MVTFGIIGTGPWGQKVHAAIKRLGFECRSCGRNGVEELMDASDIVWIAAHPSIHTELAERALHIKKPTVVEKPVSFNHRDVMTLNCLSEKNETTFVTDYTHLFNRELMEFLSNGYKTLAITLAGEGPPRNYDALWDYGSHALAIVLETVQKTLTDIVASSAGSSYRLYFEDVVVNVTVSNNATEKVADFVADGVRFTPTIIARPLQCLITRMAQNHLGGGYWTNGHLAVQVTELLERLHRCE